MLFRELGTDVLCSCTESQSQQAQEARELGEMVLSECSYPLAHGICLLSFGMSVMIAALLICFQL